MNRKGLELAVSTLVLLVLGVVILIGGIYILTEGFTTFRGTTGPLSETSAITGVREACRIACTAGDRATYCCKNFTIGENFLECKNSELEINCNLGCEGFSCIENSDN